MSLGFLNDLWARPRNYLKANTCVTSCTFRTLPSLTSRFYPSSTTLELRYQTASCCAIADYPRHVSVQFTIKLCKVMYCAFLLYLCPSRWISALLLSLDTRGHACSWAYPLVVCRLHFRCSLVAEQVTVGHLILTWLIAPWSPLSSESCPKVAVAAAFS